MAARDLPARAPDSGDFIRLPSSLRKGVRTHHDLDHRHRDNASVRLSTGRLTATGEVLGGQRFDRHSQPEI